MTHKPPSLFDWKITGPAIGDSFRKLAARSMVKNPVMFVTMVGAILTTVDAGTRVGRFMLQDTLGNVYRPLPAWLTRVNKAVLGLAYFAPEVRRLVRAGVLRPHRRGRVVQDRRPDRRAAGRGRRPRPGRVRCRDADRRADQLLRERRPRAADRTGGCCRSRRTARRRSGAGTRPSAGGR